MAPFKFPGALKMSTNENVLGVDFGTSNSAAGTLVNGRPHLFEVEPGQKTLPTAFFFDFDERETLIGGPATQALIDGRDGRFMRALKRVLGTPLMHEPRQILNERVTFVEIIARLLRQIKACAEAQSGQVFDHALSGRPVHFHDNDAAKDKLAEEDLKACYQAAGFKFVSFMLEPQAAAIASASGGAHKQLGLIVDIGGGTSDFSVFETETRGDVSILSNSGSRIGGTDFDRALSILTVMPLLGKGSLLRMEMGADLTPTPNAIFNDLATWEKIPFLYNGKTRKMVADMHKLATEPQKLGRLTEVLTSELGHDLAFLVEKGKIAANAEGDDTQIDLNLLEQGLSAPLSTALLNEALDGFVDTIKGSVMDAIRAANLTPERIDKVVYVGGSSLIGLVYDALDEMFPGADHAFSDVFTAVARGLAIASARA